MTPDIIHHPQGGAAAAVAGAAAMLGTALGVINPILQAMAYSVSIVAGLLAIVRYVRRDK